MRRILLTSIALCSYSFALAQPTLVNKAYIVTNFDTVVADGYYNLTVQPTSGQAQVATASYAEAPITVSVHDHTLYIVSRYAAQGPYAYYQGQSHPHVELQLPSWQGLSVYGPVNVQAKNIPTQGFSLMSEGYGTVDIVGAGQLRSIKQRGTNVVKLHGIKSESLSLDATDSSDLTLEGTADYFYARLDNQAKLQARDLAANHITIQARGNAVGRVYPLQTLRAFTDQSGAIYYFKQPKNITLNPTQSGNVFEMK